MACAATADPDPLTRAACTGPLAIDGILIERETVRVERRFADALDVRVDLFGREVHGQTARGAREDARVLHGEHGLTVEARVVDRDGGVIREREEQLLVVRVEAALGEIEDADRADDEPVRDAGNGNDVAGIRYLAEMLPHRMLARGGDAFEGECLSDGQVAGISMRRGDHHRALLDESESGASRVQQLGGVAYDEREHAIELERLVDALHDLRERTRFARALLGAHERRVADHRRQRRFGMARITRAMPCFLQQIESRWKTSARVKAERKPANEDDAFWDPVTAEY